MINASSVYVTWLGNFSPVMGVGFSGGMVAHGRDHSAELRSTNWRGLGTLLGRRWPAFSQTAVRISGGAPNSEPRPLC